MAGIRIGGLASGLPPNLIDQVLEAERSPIKQMEAKKNSIQDKVKLVSELETKINDINKNMNSLVGRKGFIDKKLDSNLPEVVNGTLDTDIAEPGSFALEVSQLATKSAVVSSGFPDKDQTKAGVGYIKFQTDEGEKEIYISNEDESTLEKIAEKINASNLGVKASVINDVNNKDRGYKLELYSEKTGEDEKVIFPTAYLLDGEEDLDFNEYKEPQNAVFKLNGHEFQTADNIVKDILPGVTLDLKQAKPGAEVRINISENYDAIAEKVKGFVDSYNAALSFVHSQNKLSPDGKGRERLGPLGGESMTRMTEMRLKEIIQSPQMTNSSIKRISELGVEFTREGTLKLNADKLKKVVNNNPKDVVAFLQGNNVDVGFIPSMNRRLRQLVDPNSGAVGAKKQNLQSQTNQIDDRIERKERSLEKREAQLRKQFSQMEESMSKLQGQAPALGGMKG